MSTTKQSLLKDYQAELAYALKLKADGVEYVTADTSGEELANGRKFVPIDEYIGRWQNGVNVLSSDDQVDIETWNY